MQYDFSEQVPRFQTLVCLRRIGERIFRGDRNSQFRSFHSPIEALELTAAGHKTVEDHLHPEPRLWKGFHSVQIRDSTSAVVPERIDAVLEGLASGESQYGIDAVWGKALGGGLNVSASPIYHCIGPQSTHKG
jgi:hypothetical protein